VAKIPPVRELKGRTLGRILIKMGLLTRDKVHKALVLQKKNGGKLGQVFIEQGFIKPAELRIALAAQRGMEFVDIKDLEISKEIQERVPSQMARTYEIIPVEYDKSRNQLTVAMKSPDNFRAMDDLSTLMGWRPMGVWRSLPAAMPASTSTTSKGLPNPRRSSNYSTRS
jgi:type IV pilus assembly protein PilB